MQLDRMLQAIDELARHKAVMRPTRECKFLLPVTGREPSFLLAGRMPVCVTGRDDCDDGLV